MEIKAVMFSKKVDVNSVLNVLFVFLRSKSMSKQLEELHIINLGDGSSGESVMMRRTIWLERCPKTVIRQQNCQLFTCSNKWHQNFCERRNQRHLEYRAKTSLCWL